MADERSTSQNNGEQPNLSTDDATQVVRALGLVFSNSLLYGANHGVTRKAIDDAFRVVSVALDIFTELAFVAADDQLLVNRVSVELKNPLSKAFADQVAVLDIGTFAISGAMSRERFEHLIELMTAAPDALQQLGGFQSALETLGIEGVTIKKVVYREVAEDEAVVTSEVAEAVEEIATSEILDFLKSEGSLDEVDATDDDRSASKLADAVEKLSGKPEIMADVLMEAAKAKDDADPQEAARQFREQMLHALQKTHESLMACSSAKTQKGRRQIKKALKALREELAGRMKDAGHPEAQPAIDEAFAGMQDELEVESLAREYIKKRSAIEGSEKRILRYMKRKGLENIEESELHRRLEEEGLSKEDWEALLIKSGELSGSGPGDRGSEGLGAGLGGGVLDDVGLQAVNDLAETLARVEKELKETGVSQVPADQIHDQVMEADKQVTELANQTAAKIEVLVEAAQADVEDEARAAAESPEKLREFKPRLPRKQLLEVLGEIGQELCQPLSVIHCTVDMILARMLGDINARQKEMLEMVSASGGRLQTLIDRLISIAGVPDSHHPDAEITGSLYEGTDHAPE